VSLSREDMLRELELLPVWRARLPVPAPLSSVTMPSVPIVTPVPVVEAEPAIEVAVALVTEPVVEVVLEEAEAPITEAPQAAWDALEVDKPGLPEVVAVEPLVQTPWLLYCPQASNVQSQQLLQNIMRALQLPLEEVALYQQPLQVAQVKSRFCVLFGLEQANQFLAADYADLAAIRGQILTYGDMVVIVTHHPQAMLESPLLKREVWEDLCLLLARQAAVAA